jgi:dihydroorotate dehydrogenase electron transfer subunit
MNSPQIKEILYEKLENNEIKTFKFDFTEKMTSGQFFMIWIPGVDEIPMSVSYIDKYIKGITFRRVGKATNALFGLNVGDKIGVRGPYGNGFKIFGEKILFVGGGTGIAMLAPAIEEAVAKNISSTVILGVRNIRDIFFEDRIKKCGVKYYISTDDGSKGYKGFASDLAKDILCKNSINSVFTCGPENMMKKLFEICGSINFQASLERYMKCGVGICSHCCLGNGLRVCVEGPVFEGLILKNIKDFGLFKRDASGRKIRF